MSKEIFDKISNKYTDINGFLTYHTKNQSDPYKGIWDGTNPHLWTGQLNILLRLKGCYFNVNDSSYLNHQIYNFNTTINSTSIRGGLNTRHAPWELYLMSDEYDSISLDEHDGICFSDAALDTSRSLELLAYGENNNWAFVEKEPNVNPYPKTIKEYINIFKGLYEIIKFAIKTKDYDGSGEMDQIIFKYPEIVRLTRIRVGKDRAFIRLINGKKPGLLSYIHLIMSLYFSARGNKSSGHNRSFYRFAALGLRGVKGYWITKAFKYFDKKMIEKYGITDYILPITIKRMKNKDNPIFDVIGE